MSNSIWHTADQKPEPDARRWIYEKPSPTFPYGVSYRHTITAGCLVKAEWAYIDDLIAQADKAERLQKAVDVAVDALKRIKEPTAWGSLYQEQEIATDALETIGKHKE